MAGPQQRSHNPELGKRDEIFLQRSGVRRLPHLAISEQNSHTIWGGGLLEQFTHALELPFVRRLDGKHILGESAFCHGALV